MFLDCRVKQTLLIKDLKEKKRSQAFKPEFSRWRGFMTLVFWAFKTRLRLVKGAFNEHLYLSFLLLFLLSYTPPPPLYPFLHCKETGVPLLDEFGAPGESSEAALPVVYFISLLLHISHLLHFSSQRNSSMPVLGLDVWGSLGNPLKATPPVVYHSMHPPPPLPL